MIAENPALQECLALTKGGGPWHVAIELDPEERSGMCIALGIIDGNQFDWKARKWIS